MALIKCSECNGQISDKANSCPHCGNPIIVNSTPIPIIDSHEVPLTRIEEHMKRLAEGMLTPRLIHPEEREALIKIILEKNSAGLAKEMLFAFDSESSPEKRISAEETSQLKQIILESKDADIACLVIINLSRLFTEKEKDVLRVSAVKTTNAHFAFYLYKEEWRYLGKHKEAKAVLRRIVVSANNPETAIAFLKESSDNLAAEAEDLSSLAFTSREIEHFKQVVFSSNDPLWALRLLQAGEKTPDSDEYDEFSDTFGLPVELTPAERTALKRLIIEGQNPDYAYTTLRSITNLSESERMVLKEIMMQTKEPSMACQILCYSEGVPSLNRDEHTYLRRLAAQVKEPYAARSALEKIFDLAPDERTALEAVSKDGAI